MPRAQRLGEGAADPGCSRGWAQRVMVADLVQSDVALDVLGELHGVTYIVEVQSQLIDRAGGQSRRTRLARVRHEEMRAERLDLVLVRLHLHDGARGGRVGRDDDIVLPRQSE